MIVPELSTVFKQLIGYSQVFQLLGVFNLPIGDFRPSQRHTVGTRAQSFPDISR
jgi:hypothetical protein